MGWDAAGGFLMPPDHLYLEITDRCNLRCKHCYLSANSGGQHMLDSSLIEAALLEFASLGGHSVAFSGGEPLLHPRLEALVAQAQGLGLRSLVVTNGILLDRRLASSFIGLGVRIALSVEGVQEETHDAIRGPRSFKQIRAALDRLTAMGAQEQATICFTPTRQNLKELTPLVRTLSEEGFRHFYVSLLEARGRERTYAPELALDTEALVNLLIQLAFLIIHPGDGIQIDAGHLQFLFDRLLGHWDGVGDPLETTLRIAPTGQVYLTAYTDDEKFLLGDLQTSDLRRCYFSPRLAALHAETIRRQAGLPACLHCPYWIICGGGSPARAFRERKRLDVPDEFCEAKRIFLERWFGAL